METGQSLNQLRSGNVFDSTLNVFGSIVPGSTTGRYLGITMTSHSSNLPLDISSMITPLLIGPTPFHAFGAPGVGNLCFLLL